MFNKYFLFQIIILSIYKIQLNNINLEQNKNFLKLNFCIDLNQF